MTKHRAGDRRLPAGLTAAGLLILLFTGGCASTKSVFLDNGTRGYLIRCGGFFNSWESCLVKAGNVCRVRGYTTIRSVEYDRTLLVACKSGDGAH